jgi:iron uptake system component EfeO
MHLPALSVFISLSAVLALAGCTAKTPPAASSSQSPTTGAIHVTADETSCQLDRGDAATGKVTFHVTNNGAHVTEFYVYATGDRVMGEVENIAPGQSRQLIVAVPEPGTYQTLCRPGMSGAGIRSDFTVTGAAAPESGNGPLLEAAAGYKRYLASQVGALKDTAATFVSAIEAGDIAAAKAQYPTSRTYYERVEPVAESFPDDLDRRLDLREADETPAAPWTGSHRLEKDLWVTGLQPDTRHVARQLLADIDELVAGVNAPDFNVDAVHIAGGAQTLLDEIARTKITGEEDIFSHTDLWDFQANIDGSQAAIASVRSIVDERNPQLGKQIDRRFGDVDAELAHFRTPDGYVGYDTVDQAHRTTLSQRIDALSSVVSQVQPIIAQP